LLDHYHCQLSHRQRFRIVAVASFKIDILLFGGYHTAALAVTKKSGATAALNLLIVCIFTGFNSGTISLPVYRSWYWLLISI
jgi:hypothetical protein